MPMSHIPIACLATSAVFTAPAAFATAVINEQSLVPVGLAVGCCCFLGALIWKASATLQRIADRLDEIEREMSEVKRTCDQRHRI